MVTSIKFLGVLRKYAFLPLLIFIVMLYMPIFVIAGTVNNSTSQKIAEVHNHSEHDHDSGLHGHDNPGDLDSHRTTIRDTGHNENTVNHKPDDAPIHNEEHHQRELVEDHEEHDHEHEKPLEIHFSQEQRQTLNLEISVLERRTLGKILSAPGEVRLNAYRTAQLTPRIPAQVLARHARLGEHIDKGQLLVTLSSVDMAEAQGDLVVAEREWQRLTKLKKQYVSDRELLEAGVARQKALSSVLAYGMTKEQAKSLVAESDKADGTFQLLAPAGGTVIRDDFVLGELVEPGRVLFEITDESVRWIEARMVPEEAVKISIGDRARIAYRKTWLDGHVTQIHHLLDEVTRTQAVRLEVPDPEHRLHPGVFVDVLVFPGKGESVLAVPETAVLRSPDGDWQLFVVDGENTFRAVEVELIRTVGGIAVIEGIPAGTKIVTNGGFFLQSELAKSGFDPHNH